MYRFRVGPLHFPSVVLVGLALWLIGCRSSDALTDTASVDCSRVTEQATAGPPVESIETTQPPHLIGGLRGFANELDYPSSAKATSIWARITVRFIVSPAGCAYAVTPYQTTLHSQKGAVYLLTHPAGYDGSLVPRGLPLSEQRFIRDQNWNNEIDAGEEHIRFDQFPTSVQDLLTETFQTVEQTRWRPGRINGEPVAVTMTLPVTFVRR